MEAAGQGVGEQTIRLDKALVKRRMICSRTQGEKAIARGAVQVNGKVVRKVSYPITPKDVVRLTEGNQYVARSAYKLKHALDMFKGISVQGKKCLDIGASTGGFTQVLLEEGARKVVSVDVGHGQMASRIARNPKVSLIEKTNARYLTPTMIEGPAELITSDVSFISSTLIMPSIADCAAVNADILTMVKPQFEVGKKEMARSAVIRSQALWEYSIRQVVRSALGQQLVLCGLCRNRVAGQNGNVEFFLWVKKVRDGIVRCDTKDAEVDSAMIMRSAVFSSILKEDESELKRWIRRQIAQ